MVNLKAIFGGYFYNIFSKVIEIFEVRDNIVEKLSSVGDTEHCERYNNNILFIFISK